MAQTVHLLSQYLWPDDAPTGVYVEQVADSLLDAGVPVALVAGTGSYRHGRRTPPRTPIERVDHFEGSRGNLWTTAIEYGSVARAFAGYIRTRVQRGDIVVITSAPPTTLFLDRDIRARGAIGVYWLQDYYPQLVRGVLDMPRPARRALGLLWRHALGRWQHVVKAAGNLGYSGANATVIRNWHTLDLGAQRACQPKTALYSGNLGYGHHIPSFIELCRTLQQRGYSITVRGDGPGMSQLPDWIPTAKPFTNPDDLVRSYWDAEVHLIAGHPELADAVFPSKFWNARVTGREVLGSGFAGAMAEELAIAKQVDFRDHLGQWRRFLLSLLGSSNPARP